MSTAENPWAGQGAVLLDIGDDIGALVVTMPSAMVDAEVEIRPVGVVAHHSHGGHAHSHGHAHDDDHGHSHRDGHLAHVAVVERPVGERTIPSLVFGELTAGRYDLFEKGHPDDVVLTVDVEGGQVATTAWPV